MPTSTITAELIRRCELRGMCTATTRAAAVLGTAVDAGIIELSELLDLVKSCSSADELGNALLTLAASAYCLIPPPAGRVFRVVGEVEGEDVWTR